MKKLVKCKHPSLMSTDGSTVKTNQASIYQKLFHRTFPAHDAMEDVRALRKILFNSSLNVSDEMLTEIMCTTKHAENDMKYLDHRHALVQTFKRKLYQPTDPSFPIKQQIVEKIAGTGLSYQHLEDIFEKFGEKALIGVLSLPQQRTNLLVSPRQNESWPVSLNTFKRRKPEFNRQKIHELLRFEGKLSQEKSNFFPRNKRHVRSLKPYILVPRGRAPFGQHQESRPLAFTAVKRLGTRVNTRVIYALPVTFTLHPTKLRHSDHFGTKFNHSAPTNVLFSSFTD